MEDIEISFDKFVERAMDKLDAFARQTIQQVAENVIQDTPVDTGFLRGQWHATIGSPQAPEKPADLAGAGAQSQIALTVAQLKGGDVLYVMNGAAYVRPVEYGRTGQRADGSSYIVSGRHMVTDNVRRAQQVADEVAAQLIEL